MKKIILFLLAVAVFQNCKSFDPVVLNARGEMLNPKLPAMEKVIENNYTYIITPNGEFTGPNPQDVSVLFDREISEKLTDPYSDKRGYLVLKINTIKHKVKMGFGSPILYFFLGLPTLFGATVWKASTNLEVQIDVLNVNRKLVGSYRGSSNYVIKSGNGKKSRLDGRSLARTSYIMAVSEAIQDAKKNMMPDAARLTKALQ